MRMSKVLVVTVAAVGATGSGMAAHADGKAKFEADCAECHEAGDFTGEDAKALGETLKKIVAGQQKHKGKISLTDAEIASVASFMATGK
jgi:mono/diheme cytochrome c family protein